MTKTLVRLAAVLAVSSAIAVAPWQTGPSVAQTGPMEHGGQMGQGDAMMAQLDQLTGDDFDKAFLVQMSVHHAMAIMMARPAAASAPHQEAADLAKAIIGDQAADRIVTILAAFKGIERGEIRACLRRHLGGTVWRGDGVRTRHSHCGKFNAERKEESLA